MDAGAVGIILLAPALRLAKAAYIETEALLNIHPDLKARMSPIDLQTISDICLDLFRLRSIPAVTDCRQGDPDEECKSLAALPGLEIYAATRFRRWPVGMWQQRR